MQSAKQIGTKTVVIDGEDREVRVFEPALPKPKRKNEANPRQKVRSEDDSDWNIRERTASGSHDLPNRAFGRRSRQEERHREEDAG